MIQGVDGLISGLDTTSLVDSMIRAQRGTARRFEDKRELSTLKLDATRTLNLRLLSAKLDLVNLRRASTYTGRSATASDTAVVKSVTANSSVATGSYDLHVTQVAQAHQLSSGGFASKTAAIGAGTVSLQVGNGVQADITIDGSNSSLEGLRDAINAAGVGARAQIIDDGSGDTPYRLILTSEDTGAANTIAFDTSGLSGTGSDALQRVTSPTTFTGAGGTAALSGFYEGSSLPDLRIRVADTAGGTTGEDVAYEISTDGGSTYTAVTNNTAGVIDLKAELGLAADAADLSVDISGGSLTVGDVFTLRPLQQLTAAQDTKLTFGSSGSTFEVTRDSRTLDDLIDGMVIELGSATGSSTITVNNDSSGAIEDVATFVDNFNTAAQYLYTNSDYDTETGEAGILQSESSLVRGFNDIITALTGRVANGTGTTVASGVGLTLTDEGLLELDEAALAQALADDPAAVRALFANAGVGSNAGIEFVSMTGDTDTSITHSIAVTQAAEKARLVGTKDLRGGVTIDGSSDLLELEVNGKEVSLELAEQTFGTGDELVAHIQKLLDSEDALANDRVTVDLDAGGQLRFTSQRFGSSQNIAIGSGTALTALGFTSGASDDGLDVAGTIDGVTATGRGQALTGTSGSGEGLTVLVTLSAADVAGGNDSATMDITRGIAQRANDAIEDLTDAAEGLIPGMENRLTSEIERLDERIVDIDERLEIRRQRLLGQFRQMEQLLAGFQSQQQFLGGQIQAFQNMAAARSGNQ